MAAENSGGSAVQRRGRPFPKGVSGNPGGRPRTIAAIEEQIRELHGPRALAVLDKMGKLAMRGSVPAARVYLDRVLGAVRRPDAALDGRDGLGALAVPARDLTPADLSAIEETGTLPPGISDQDLAASLLQFHSGRRA